MNIYFDARWLRTDHHDGISRYTHGLATALAKLHPITLILCDKKQLHLLPPDIPYIMVAPATSPRELLLPYKLNHLGADVVFSPMQIMGTRGRKYKLIFTLHDLIYYRHPTPPTHLDPFARLLWWLFHRADWPQRWVLNQADYVVTVSETSKKEIAQRKLTNRPIGVVYNAPAALKAPDQPPKTKKELVFMGSFMPYKNVELLLHAMPLLPDYKLHLVSRISPERRTELEKLIENKNQVKFWNGISDEDYAQLLASATALVSASKDEGFGLPLVEAMAVGTPVVCTDMPIFHEVAGQGGQFFDPDSPESFTAAIRQLEDPKTRQSKIKNGYTQAQKFSWEKSAQALLDIITKL